MEWAIEKCTELDVSVIVPVVTQRTEKHLALAADKRVERWRRIAREAAEQSRRIAPPEIADPVKLKQVLAGFSHIAGVIPSEGSNSTQRFYGHPGCNLRVVLAETEREAIFSNVLCEHDDVTSLAIAIGPEGGWTQEELQGFETSHWVAASLGDTILRAETAAIAAVAVARAEL